MLVPNIIPAHIAVRENKHGRLVGLKGMTVQSRLVESRNILDEGGLLKSSSVALSVGHGVLHRLESRGASSNGNTAGAAAKDRRLQHTQARGHCS